MTYFLKNRTDMPAITEQKTAVRPDNIVTDPSLDKKYANQQPLFPHKIEKAKAIMEKVRQREAEMNK